jgi:hypothetical protein
MGEPSINGPFSMAMLNIQGVTIIIVKDKFTHIPEYKMCQVFEQLSLNLHKYLRAAAPAADPGKNPKSNPT